MHAMRCIAVGFAAIVATSAFGQTVIRAKGDCGTVTFVMTRGIGGGNEGATLLPDEVATARVFEPKRRVDVTPTQDSRSLRFDGTVPDNFVAMAAVDLKPVVNGNETRTEHAKALFFCGATTPDADWQRETGLGLEIYPQSWNGPRPRMKRGEPMRFIVVDKQTGKLLRDLPMQLYAADGTHIADGTAAKDVGMNFAFPEPGRYTVVATYRRPDPKQPEHQLVDVSTLTFDVK